MGVLVYLFFARGSQGGDRKTWDLSMYMYLFHLFTDNFFVSPFIPCRLAPSVKSGCWPHPTTTHQRNAILIHTK